jgi:hypothetical protein
VTQCDRSSVSTPRIRKLFEERTVQLLVPVHLTLALSVFFLALFLRRIRVEFVLHVWDQDDVDISRFYVRFVARRDDYIAPNLLSINVLLMSKHCAKIGGLALRANRTFEMGKTYSRVRLADATADNGVSAAARWTKARLWRELLRASPATTPRFKTYLAHHVVKGPCGSWCVVATKHVV